MDVIWQPFEGRRFRLLERHFAVTQAFIPLEGSPAVVAVAAPTDIEDPDAIPRPEDVRAFLIDPGKGYAYKTGTWHSLDRYLLRPPGASFVILNVDPNPTQFVDYAERFGVEFEVGRGGREAWWRLRRKGNHFRQQRCAARPPTAGCAGPHREDCPEVGVPLPWGP